MADFSRKEFAAKIDHTVLGPETTLEEVKRVLDEAVEHGMNACIPPCYLSQAATHASEVTLATVVGFPHGQHSSAVKRYEAETAWQDGGNELDVVINIGRLKAGHVEAVRTELSEIVASVPIPVKVIIETGLLSDEEKRQACSAARDADADMVKTSTGFAEGGARVADVELMSEYLPVKASGGVGSYAEAKAMLDAGAERIGASSGVAIVEGHPG